jgi:hypothetical protein
MWSTTAELTAEPSFAGSITVRNGASYSSLRD